MECILQYTYNNCCCWFTRHTSLMRPVFIRANSTFQSAVDRLKSVKSVDNSQKLKLYALYKQATVGKNTSKKPGLMDLVGKAKWEAWNELGEMSQVRTSN